MRHPKNPNHGQPDKALPHNNHTLTHNMEVKTEPTVTTQFKRLWDCIVTDKGQIVNDSKRTLNNGAPWMDSTKEMLVRDCWKDLMNLVLSKKNVLLRGKAGRGKSMFALFMIFEILTCAMEKKTSPLLCPPGKAFPEDPLIVYVDREGNRHKVTLSSVSLLAPGGWPPGVHYYVSDNVDITEANIGSHLTMGITSGEADKLKEFRKRISAMVEEDKVIVYMPSLQLEEMSILFPLLSAEAVQFKFDIVGGNPRVIHQDEEVAPESNFYHVVLGAVVWMFGDEYQPSEAEVQSPQQTLGKWAINVVVSAIELAVQESGSSSSMTDSSLFREFVVHGGYKKKIEQFSSRFLGYVAAKLTEAGDANLLTSLKALFGAGGMGSAFEFTAHAKIISEVEDHWCYSSTGRYEQFALGKRRTALIRNVADIANLRPCDYGLPTVCNFPIVDAVLPPDLALQMTISDRHEVSAEKLADIRAGMIVNETFNIVFVVPDRIVPDFTFPKNLGDTRMWITVPGKVTRAALGKMCKNRADCAAPKPPRKRALARPDQLPAGGQAAPGDSSGATTNPVIAEALKVKRPRKTARGEAKGGEGTDTGGAGKQAKEVEEAKE